MPKNLQHMAVVAGSTAGSRVLGLLRDILIFAALGAGRVNDAFVLAFTFPNLFRRLLGEGAMTSALIPVFGRELAAGRGGFFALLNAVLRRLLPVLAGLALVFGLIFGGLWLWGGEALDAKWALAAQLGVLLIPYLVLICAAAVIVAALQILERFAVAALSPILLNLSIIIALGGLGLWMAETPEQRVFYLCAGVLIGGALQLAAPVWALMREGWRPRVVRAAEAGDHAEQLREVWALLLPGLGGAAILQINILVSRVIAFEAAPDGASIVYLANRLMELPLGVFTISITTVVFPALSRLAAAADARGFSDTFHQGLRLILAIMLPAAAGLALLAEPIVTALFAWGRFGAEDVARSVPVVAVYALGLPFYAIASLQVRAFHAKKDMRTPLRVSVWNLGINLGLSLLLVVPLGILGLALANILASALQCLMLALSLRGSLQSVGSAPLRHALQALAATAAMSLGLIFAYAYLPWPEPPKLRAFTQIATLIPAAILIYGGLLYWMRFPDLPRKNPLARR